MNRRKFIVATGTTTIGASMFHKLNQQPSLAVDGDLGFDGKNVAHTVRSDTDEFGALQLTLTHVNIETNNINEDDVNIIIEYTIGEEDPENVTNITGVNDIQEGNTYPLLKNIDDLEPNEDGTSEEYSVNVTIEVNHDEVPSQKLQEEFTFEIIKEFIDDIKFVTTNDKVTFDETDDNIDETDTDVFEGIIETNTINEMTTLGE